MIEHPLFENVPIRNIFCLGAAIFEIPRERFIIKPTACRGSDVSTEIYQLLFLFSIVFPAAIALGILVYIVCFIFQSEVLNILIYFYIFFWTIMLNFFISIYNATFRNQYKESIKVNGNKKTLQLFWSKTINIFTINIFILSSYLFCLDFVFLYFFTPILLFLLLLLSAP